jgi:hypothetical protein
MKSMFLIFILTTSFSPLIFTSYPSSERAPSMSMRECAAIAWAAADNADRAYRIKIIEKEIAEARRSKGSKEGSCCCCQ